MSRLNKNLLKKQSPEAKPTRRGVRIGNLTKFSVKALLDDQDNKPTQKRYNPDYQHVSGVLKDCPRYLVLLNKFKEKLPNHRAFLEDKSKLTGGHLVTFRIGRAVEAHIREGLNEALGYNDVFGIWSCDCKHTKVVGLNTLETCPRCGTDTKHYDEYSLKDEEAAIVGNPDLLFFFNDKFMPLEIKSINKKDFDELTEPIPGHIQQVLFYRYLLMKLGKPVHDTCKIIYCTKDFKFGSPYKEFDVSALEDHNQLFVETTYESAKGIKFHIETSTLPQRTWCPSPTCTNAKNCPMCAECFSLP